MIPRKLSKLAGCLFLCMAACRGACQAAPEEMVISHRLAETPNDKREAYNIALLQLALEKTKEKYGPYRMQSIPKMNTPRSLYAASLNIYPNLILEISYDESHVKKGDLTYVNFPVDLGVVGIRVCFVNTARKEKISKIKTLEELRQYSIGQGVGWADTTILRANGFRVIAGRVDLFCRGANEVFNEYDTFKYLKGLAVEESFAIVYPLPRFYFLSSHNTVAKARIEEGLRIAYDDGSLMQLWNQHYAESINFTHLKQRRIFRIVNPLIVKLPRDYEQYFYDPFK
jgi:hypothetical protein